MNGTALTNPYFVLRCQNTANYLQIITKNGHVWYFTSSIEQLIFHFELGQSLSMLWTSICRMERNVPLVPVDHSLCPPRPGAQTSSPYSTQTPISSQLVCENSPSSFPKTFPLLPSHQKKRNKRKGSVVLFWKNLVLPKVIKQTFLGNHYLIFYMKKYFMLIQYLLGSFNCKFTYLAVQVLG